ncbi:ABC transporter substrate-binding protein [Paenibacillus sp. 1P07SE]|uniref:ABC transporter substrate-binding protein n=1 Tax=Paenibacillus sp. 1P07SE TaxID=3132209 RepID=UPI0039A40218
MRGMGKGISGVLATVMVLVLAACGSSGDNAPATGGETAEETKDTKLRIVWWGSQARHDATNKVLEIYTEAHPHITFEPDFSGFDSYWDKLATQSAARNAPDIIQMDAQYFNEYAGRNQLADLSSGINVDALDENLLAAGRYEDKLYAIPIGSNPFGIVYNQLAIEKMGLTVPEEWTWDEMFQLARDIQPKLEQGKYALRDFTVDGEVYEMFQLSKGKGPLAQDGELNLDAGVWQEWVGLFDELRQEGVVPPAEISVAEKKYDPQQDLLLNGTVLIKQSYASDFPAWESVQPGAFALAKAPRSEQAGGYVKPSMYWSVSAHSAHIEEAKQFIDYFINNEEAADVLGVIRGIPVSSDILTYLEPKLTEADKAQLGLINVTRPDANPFTVGPKGFGSFIVDFNKVGAELVFGRISAEQAYTDIERYWEADIK